MARVCVHVCVYMYMCVHACSPQQPPERGSGGLRSTSKISKLEKKKY